MFGNEGAVNLLLNLLDIFITFPNIVVFDVLFKNKIVISVITVITASRNDITQRR